MVVSVIAGESLLLLFGALTPQLPKGWDLVLEVMSVCEGILEVVFGDEGEGIAAIVIFTEGGPQTLNVGGIITHFVGIINFDSMMIGSIEIIRITGMRGSPHDFILRTSGQMWDDIHSVNDAITLWDEKVVFSGQDHIPNSGLSKGVQFYGVAVSQPEEYRLQRGQRGEGTPKGVSRKGYAIIWMLHQSLLHIGP